MLKYHSILVEHVRKGLFDHVERHLDNLPTEAVVLVIDARGSLSATGQTSPKDKQHGYTAGYIYNALLISNS